MPGRMKPVLCWLLLSFSLWGEALSWRGDYEAALDEARRTGRPLWVLVVKSNDALSRTILQHVFMHRAYIGKLNREVVAVMVTYETEASYPVELYYTTHFPTLFRVDSKTELFIEKPWYGREITPEAVRTVMVSDSSR